jgi:lipoprotein-anchoring transpeptidase ErfK/SrfK
MYPLPTALRPIAVVSALAVALGLAGCGTDAGATPTDPGADHGSRTSATADSAARRAVSVVDRPLAVRTHPAADAPVRTRLAPQTPLGSPRVLLVRGVTAGWVQVSLPVRPNGGSGWVAADDVALEPVSGRIDIDLAARRMTYRVDGRQPTTTSVAVGSPTNPTPTGHFYVTDRVRPENPHGAYGAFSLGLSAHSETLSEFGSGDGQIGIHGTNQPASIGRAVSHGCVRVPADVAELLAEVPLGTPVVIR